MSKIPTPAELAQRRATTAVVLAPTVKELLVEAMESGRTYVDLPETAQRFASEIHAILEPVFDKAGWILLDHGGFFSVRPK